MPEPTTKTATSPALLSRLHDAVMRRQRFLITSHARPDGDSIGSQLALAQALKWLGKDVRVVNVDGPPTHYLELPNVTEIEVSDRAQGDFDAAVVLECTTVKRPGLDGLDRYFIINIDHHTGNTMYGALNWFDESAAACGEMVFDLIVRLDVPITTEIATHLYVAILTDTGSFHHSNITPRTFEICRQLADAGADPTVLARQVLDSWSVGKLKLLGSLLASMQLEANGQLAVLSVDSEMLTATGCTDGDLEGVINVPLQARQIRAAILFKALHGEVRVSLRSKDEVDVRTVATAFDGGGHRNASGFTVSGRFDEVRAVIIDRVAAALHA